MNSFTTENKMSLPLKIQKWQSLEFLKNTMDTLLIEYGPTYDLKSITVFFKVSGIKKGVVWKMGVVLIQGYTSISGGEARDKLS